MKQTALKVSTLALLVLTPFLILAGLSDGRSSSYQNLAGQAAPAEKPIEQVFKNIRVLNGMPQTQLYPTMRFMAVSLGVQCGFCHVIRDGQLDSAADDKPEKQTARVMIKMVLDLNKTYAQGNPTVSCYTCHRGRTSPQGSPTLPLLLPSARPPNAAGVSVSNVPGATSGTAPNSTVPLPSPDDILSKYLTAIGGKATIDLIHSCAIKGSTTTSAGQLVPYEAEQMAPDKGHESFAIQNVAEWNCVGDSRCEYERVVNGQQGWLKSGQGVQELLGEQLADEKLSLLLFGVLRLKNQYSSFRVSGRDKIDDRDVYTVSTVRSDNKLERLYFDVESGVLRRRVSYMRTMIGTIPQQTDFEDYREVDGLKLPFTITLSSVDARSVLIIRKFAEIKLNVTVNEANFNKPLTARTPAP